MSVFDTIINYLPVFLIIYLSVLGFLHVKARDIHLKAKLLSSLLLGFIITVSMAFLDALMLGFDFSLTILFVALPLALIQSNILIPLIIKKDKNGNHKASFEDYSSTLYFFIQQIIIILYIIYFL